LLDELLWMAVAGRGRRPRCPTMTSRDVSSKVAPCACHSKNPGHISLYASMPRTPSYGRSNILSEWSARTPLMSPVCTALTQRSVGPLISASSSATTSSIFISPRLHRVHVGASLLQAGEHGCLPRVDGSCHDYNPQGLRTHRARPNQVVSFSARPNTGRQRRRRHRSGRRPVAVASPTRPSSCSGQHGFPPAWLTEAVRDTPEAPRPRNRPLPLPLLLRAVRRRLGRL
jgi:hypothetical protein